MDANSVGQNTTIDRKELQQLLVDTILAALDKEEITASDMREASGFIVERMEGVQNDIEYIDFLKELSSKWAIFKDITAQYKEKIYKKNEQLVMDKLSSLIGKAN